MGTQGRPEVSLQPQRPSVSRGHAPVDLGISALAEDALRVFCVLCP